MAIALLLLALTAHPHFERVGADAGVVPDSITAIYQDRSGLIWIGSRESLLMYDGHTFTPFEHDPSDPNSISDNSIRIVHEARSGDLWVGTNNGGLERLDLATRRFRHYRSNSEDPATLSYDNVHAIVEDPDGKLWVGTQRGLNRLDPATGIFERFMPDASRSGALPWGYVSCLLLDRKGNLWVGMLGGGLALFNRDSGRFTAYRHSGSDPGSLADDDVFALLEDDAGQLWVATGTGLDLLETGTHSFHHYRLDTTDLPEHAHPNVTSLAQSVPGKIWVGTYGGGLNEFDVAAKSFRQRRRSAPGSSDRADDRVTELLADRGGTLWIGTWGAGLVRLRRSGLLLASASSEIPPPSGVSDIDVNSVAADPKGGLWVGTGYGGLSRFDVATKTWKRFLRDEQEVVVRIAVSRDGRVWAGTTARLVRLDPETGATRILRHDPADSGSIGPGRVRGFLEDREGRIWVGTGESGLQRLDENLRVAERFLSDDYVLTLIEDRAGAIWVGTRSGGLIAFDPSTASSVRYRPVTAASDSLSHHTVFSILEDSRGVLWIGTGGGGLNRVEKGAGGEPARFTRFTTADGLADNNVMAILEDDDHTLWLSTKRGLSRFDPATKAFANFFVADGLPSAEFGPGAAARIGSTMYFGTVTWLVAVSAGTPFPARAPSPTVITSVRGVREDLRGDRPPWRLEQLTVPYGEWLSIETTVLDYASGATHAYAYRLGKADAPWVDLGPRRSVTFTDLAPGRYELKAKGRNDQGVWSETPVPLAITVVPPFWMTLWFRAAVAAALVAGAVAAHKVRTASLTKRNRELLDLHEQRERARADLNQAYERLRLLGRRLEAAQEDERKSIARELHDELGPTLTAVVINLQLLKDAADADRRSRRIAETVEIVDRTIQRVRELSLDLRPPLLDEMGLVTALRGYLETLSARSGVHIELSGDGGVNGLPPEVEIVAFRVVQEAVTNVVRHAGATRAVVTVERSGGRLRLTIEDDGRGFDVASSMELSATGRALGLLGMQERVLMLAGELAIDSKPGGGTTVRASLPVEAAA